MMDFLDPKRSRAVVVRLWLGYVLLAIAIVLAAIVLLYQASGFGVSREGRVIQNGLLFVSSAPSGAAVYLNDKRQGSDTNSRITLQAGTYTMKLTRDGYRDWQRAVTVEGGDVERIDYPLLIPNQLDTSEVAAYNAQPPLTLQSPDRRWVLAQVPGAPATFEVYDVREPDNVGENKTTVTLPQSIIGIAQSGQQSFELAEWSRDNQHVLLRHVVGDQSEYIMLSRSNPAESFNVSRRLQLAAGETITLQDKKFDKYFVHNPASTTLRTVSLDDQPPVTLLSGVLSYKSYGEDVVLYVTNDGASNGNVAVKLYQDDKSYPIRQIAASQSGYLLDVSNYAGDWFVVAGGVGQDMVYAYVNPAQKLQEDVTQPLVPVSVLKVAGANYIEFSANSQFIMTQNGRSMAVYDVENDRSYKYELPQPLDAPQQHTTWMDGHRLVFVSNGLTTIVDYDGTNIQSLTAAVPGLLPMFDTRYQALYAFAYPPAANDASQPAGVRLIATPLRTQADR